MNPSTNLMGAAGATAEKTSTAEPGNKEAPGSKPGNGPADAGDKVRVRCCGFCRS